MTQMTEHAPVKAYGTSNDESDEWDQVPQQQRAVFEDVDDMKKQLRARLSKPEYNVSMYYHDQGIAQRIARSSQFEQVTLIVITLNAFWIFVDTDYNPSKVLARAPAIFQLVEQFFCFFFVFEWLTRFMAFRRKFDGLRDAWFVFDSLLTLLFVIDSWVMYLIMKIGGGSSGEGLGNASLLRIVRLVRLTRMARMAHILQSVPELSILLRGLGAAMRSVVLVLVLLVSLLYVFAIVFRLFCNEEDQFCQQFFYSVPQSMHTLLIHGTLMDNLEEFVIPMQHYNLALLMLFYVFLVLAAVTVMNMLIGILCEVVNNTAAYERETLSVSYVHQKLHSIMRRAGMSNVFKGEHKINKEEFLQMIHNEAAAAVLGEVGVDPVGLVDFVDFIFKDDLHEEFDDMDEKLLSFAEFVEVILKLRGKNNATVKDIVDLRKFVQFRFANLEAKLDAIAGRPIRLRSGSTSNGSMSPYASRGMADGTNDVERVRSGRFSFSSPASRESSPSKRGTNPPSFSMNKSEDGQDSEKVSEKSRELRGVTDSPVISSERALKRRTSPVSVSMKPSQDGRDMEKVYEKTKELHGFTNGTDDIGQEGTAALSNRKDAAFGGDFKRLAHRLVLEHESALASMQRHNERLQAELDVLKLSNKPFPAAQQKLDEVVDEPVTARVPYSQPSGMQKLAEKGDRMPQETKKLAEKIVCMPQETKDTGRSEGRDINNLKEVDACFDFPVPLRSDSPGRVDWVGYIRALTPMVTPRVTPPCPSRELLELPQFDIDGTQLRNTGVYNLPRG